MPGVDNSQMEWSSMDPEIEIDEISKIYGQSTANSVQALQEINFDVYENGFISIIGLSGCGKTTLLKCLGDIIKLTRETIRIGGETAADARTNDDMFLFFQEDVLPRGEYVRTLDAFVEYDETLTETVM